MRRVRDTALATRLLPCRVMRIIAHARARTMVRGESHRGRQVTIQRTALRRWGQPSHQKWQISIEKNLSKKAKTWRSRAPPE